MKGYVHVYTGNGKGKTTAALGLSLRAAGAGLRVLIVQFLKKGDYSEIKALERFADRITVEQYGAGRFVKGAPSEADMAAGREGLERLRKAAFEGRYDLVVIEEGNVAAHCGLFPVDALLEIIHHRHETVELVITGRGADPRVIAAADLVTEMTEVKHYFKRGVRARTGIEK